MKSEIRRWKTNPVLETVELPDSGRRTTRLGFGCSGLMGGLSERESLRLLETAFEEGIRHFDVAPSYGHGMAERCLGKFLRGKVEPVTVATKYGILPPGRAYLLDTARKALRPIARRLPLVRRRLAQAANKLNTKARFRPEDARFSLKHSLRELGLDRVDLWLLHEPALEDLEESNLLPALRQFQAEDRIGAFGIGAERRRVEALWQRHPGVCRVLQFEDSILDARPEYPGAFYIRYRAISGAIGPIQSAFRGDAALARRWSDAVDADLADSEVLAALLLQASLRVNPGGMVLFSSRNPAHIQSNVRRADDPAWRERAGRLIGLVMAAEEDWFHHG